MGRYEKLIACGSQSERAARDVFASCPNEAISGSSPLRFQRGRGMGIGRDRGVGVVVGLGVPSQAGAHNLPSL